MSDGLHPSPDLRTAYATGMLPAGPALVLGVHLQTCAPCRAAVAALEEAEGQLLSAQDPIEMDPAALESALSLIAVAAPEAPPRPLRIGDVHLPDLVAEAGLQPRRWLTPSLWVAHLTISDPRAWRTFVLRAPAGATIPAHGHRGEEYISVLKGAYRDEVRVAEGDFVVNLPGADHSLSVESDEACVCLISMRGGLDWHGWSKLLGPVLGI